MKVTVLVFGNLADIVRQPLLVIDDILDTDALIDYLQSEYPDLQNHRYVVSLNKKIIQQNTIIHDGDELALLPPFSGG
ncbi:MAG: MoaD/ThiS family protein [Bacteroidetes bacterium]|nr:MoaD/ThiS family protein [Bacteroidota bacterium]